MSENVIISRELDSISVSLLRTNETINHYVRPLFRAFVADIFMNVYERSPVDTGVYRGDWDMQEVKTDATLAFRIMNNDSGGYAIFMEVGSPVGSAPWPTAREKTVEKSGTIWSKEIPEPVLGGALEKADWDGLSEQISKIITERI